MSKKSTTPAAKAGKPAKADKTPETKAQSPNGKTANVNMFTAENAKLFWEKVERKAKDACWPWKGATAKNGDRRFGIFRIAGSGYTMNQRFVYIITKGLPVSEHGVKVKSNEDCKLGELCCNPAHIVAKSESTPAEVETKAKGTTKKAPAKAKSAKAGKAAAHA